VGEQRGHAQRIAERAGARGARPATQAGASRRVSRHAWGMEKPRIVSAEDWQQEREVLLQAEKEATRAADALAARRRLLPMMRFDASYAFEAPVGPTTLLGLFEGRMQLVVYQFMDLGPDHA